jgi:hypothetical protein
MLSKPELFEPLTETPRDEARVRAQIANVVSATDPAARDKTALHDRGSSASSPSEPASNRLLLIRDGK